MVGANKNCSVRIRMRIAFIDAAKRRASWKNWKSGQSMDGGRSRQPSVARVYLHLERTDYRRKSNTSMKKFFNVAFLMSIDTCNRQCDAKDTLGEFLLVATAQICGKELKTWFNVMKLPG